MRTGRVWLTAALGIAAALWPVWVLASAPAYQPNFIQGGPVPTQLPVSPSQSLPVLHSPALSSFDSSSPECIRPAANTNVCLISWSYLYAVADPSAYVISMTVSIDGKLRSYHAGFFQTSMYIPPDLYGGYKVSCGVPGAGGDPMLGETHSYAIAARDTSGAVLRNEGNIACPADVVRVERLAVSGPLQGVPHIPYRFTAVSLPLTMTLPVTYTWRASGQKLLMATGGVRAAARFTWDDFGKKGITVTAQNLGSVITASTVITITPLNFFVPFVSNR